MLDKIYKISVIFLAISLFVYIMFNIFSPKTIIAQDNEQAVVQGQIKQLNANIMVLSNDLNVMKEEFKKASNPGDNSTKGISGRLNALNQDVRALNSLINKMQSEINGCVEDVRSLVIKNR